MIKSNLQYFIERLQSFAVWDHRDPWSSYFQGEAIWVNPETDKDGNNWLERFNELIYASNLSLVWEEKFRGEKSSLEFLLKILSFFPSGVVIAALIKLGFDKLDIQDWINRGFLYTCTNHNPVKSQDVKVASYLPWSIFIFEKYQYSFPRRRVSLPMAVLINQINEKDWESVKNKFFILWKHYKGKQEKKNIHTISGLLDGLNHGSFFVRKLVLAFLLSELYANVNKSLFESYISEIKEEMQIFSFFAELPQKISPDIFHYRHSQLESERDVSFPMEISSQFILSAVEKIYTNSGQQKNLTLLDITNDSCRQRRRNNMRIVLQQLFLIHRYHPSEASQLPDLKYLPVEGKNIVSYKYNTFLFKFFYQEGFLQRNNSAWELKGDISQLDSLPRERLNVLIFYFFMWHPGMPFLSIRNQKSPYEERTLEYIKIFFVNLFFNHRNQWLHLSFQTISGQRPAELFQELNWEKLIQMWIQSLGSLEDLQVVLSSFFSFLYDFGWIDRDHEDPFHVFISEDFPLWNPMGQNLKFSATSSDNNIARITFINDFDFDYSGDSVRDMIFISNWANLLQYGDRLIFRLDRDNIESFLAQGRHLNEIEHFISQYNSGLTPEAFLRIKKGIKFEGTLATVYPENYAIKLNKAAQCEEFFQDPLSRSAIAEIFYRKNDYIIFLKKEYLRQIPDTLLKYKISYKEKKAEELRPDTRFDFDTVHLFLLDYIFAKRLMVYFDKIDRELYKDLNRENEFIDGIYLNISRIRDIIKDAIANEKKIEIQYFAKSHGYEALNRVVKPFYIKDDYLVGHCFLRDDERMFALSRIGAIRILP